MCVFLCVDTGQLNSEYAYVLMLMCYSKQNLHEETNNEKFLIKTHDLLTICTM